MREDFLQYVWANTLFKSYEFTSGSNKCIRVINPGQHNHDSGPDFFNAQIMIDNILFVGNVEIHLRSSDWYRHGHHEDAAYNNVILSVVQSDDVVVYNNAGILIESIKLEYADSIYKEYLYLEQEKNIPRCKKQLKNLEQNTLNFYLQRLAIERLERKVNEGESILKQTGNDWEECFFRMLCKYWAGSVNSDTFYELSLHLPLRIILRHIDSITSIEALVFGVSGLLEEAKDSEYTLLLKREYSHFAQKYSLQSLLPEQWKFMRSRPQNFPTIRLALLAMFLFRNGRVLSQLLDLNRIEDILKLFDMEASEYWYSHYSFTSETSYRERKTMGNSIKRIILINSILPYMFLYGRGQGKESYCERCLEWLENIRAEKNFITKAWESCGFRIESALQSQALIQLYREYCEKHRCLQCSIGCITLKRIIKQ